MTEPFLRETEATNPMKIFEQWFLEARDQVSRLPEAMALATVDRDGNPAVRWVLLKGYDEEGFVFYTDYRSRKAREIEENPSASAGLWWQELERQVRIEGRVEKVSQELSDSYFQSRPRGSQLAVWASHQSLELASWEALEGAYKDAERTYEGTDIPRPSHWGGYRIVPDVVEFWQGKPNRLHERVRFARQGNEWRRTLLAP